MKRITTKFIQWLKEADAKVKVYEQVVKEPDNGKQIDYETK